MIPNPPEQASIIRDLTKKYPLQVGENQAYIISNSWFSMWKQIVGYDISNQNFSEKKEINHKIGPIDNNDIAVNENELDPTKKEDIDFSILSPEVWNQLIHWFGGGPQISVPVYLNSNKQPTAVIYRFYVFCKFQKEDNIPFNVFNLMQLEELSKMVRKRFKIPDDIEIRFLEIDRKRPLDLKNTIYGNELHPNVKLIIDYRRITPKNNEKWASENGFNDTIFFNLSDQETNEEEDSNQSIYDEGDSEYALKTPGVCGLRNIGNSCYYNSALQCLIHCIEFIRYFLNPTDTNDWRKNINTNNQNGTKGELVTSFVNLIKDVWCGKYVSIRPIKLKESIDKFTNQFRGTQQQDAHELLTFLLNGIHEDLNCSNNSMDRNFYSKSRNIPSHLSIMNSSGINPEDIISATETWVNHKSKNNSIIVDMFHGLLRSQIVCPFCHEMTVVFDPYMTLSLPLARQHAQTTTVIFVPFDFKKQYKKFTITYNKTEQIYELIQQKIGHRANFIFSYRQRSGSDTSFYWGFQNSGPNIDLFALEIPFVKNERAEFNPMQIESNEISQFNQNKFFNPSQQYQFNDYKSQQHPIPMHIQRHPMAQQIQAIQPKLVQLAIQPSTQLAIQPSAQFVRIQKAPSLHQLQPQFAIIQPITQSIQANTVKQIQQPQQIQLQQLNQVSQIHQAHSLSQIQQQPIQSIAHLQHPQIQAIQPIFQIQQIAPLSQIQQPQQIGQLSQHQAIQQIHPSSQMQQPIHHIQQISAIPQMQHHQVASIQAIQRPQYQQIQQQPHQIIAHQYPPQYQNQQNPQNQQQQQQSGNFHLYGGSPDFGDASGPIPAFRNSPNKTTNPAKQEESSNGDDPFYIACILRFKIHKKIPVVSEPTLVIKDASAPFLVPVENFKISREELNSQLERYFEFCWSQEEEEPSSPNEKAEENEISIDEIKEFVKDAVYDIEETELDFSQCRKSGELNPGRVMVQFPAEYYIINGENCYFKENPVWKRVSHIFYSVYINKDFMDESQNFHYKPLFNHIQFLNQISDRIANSETISLHKCFKFFSENEILDSRNQWFCKKCQKNVNANKKIDVWSAPKVLIIQLKRFVSVDDTIRKQDANIAYPELLDMSDYLVGPDKNRKCTYKLFSVCEHFGGLMGGHYTAHALVTNSNVVHGSERYSSDNYENAKWYYFNDSSVTKSSSHEAHTHNAYMLFYEKID